MAHFSPSLDSFLPPKERRFISTLIKGSFGLDGRFLSRAETSVLTTSGTLACPVQKLLGCRCRGCLLEPPQLYEAPVTVECKKGFLFNLLPITPAEKLLSVLQTGPYFPTDARKAKFLRDNTKIDVVAESIPVIASERGEVFVLIRDWVLSKIDMRVKTQELTKKETLLLFLVDSTKIINSLVETDDLLTYLTDISTYITNATTGFILKLDEQRDELFIYTARGVQPEFDKDYRIPVGQGLQDGLPNTAFLSTLVIRAKILAILPLVTKQALS